MSSTFLGVWWAVRIGISAHENPCFLARRLMSLLDSQVIDNVSDEFRGCDPGIM